MDIRIPKLGEGAESGVVVSILVKEGDAIQKDQTILELENEKAVAPIPASDGGVVGKIYVKVGDKVSVGQPILALQGPSGAPAAPAGTGAKSAPAPARPAAPAAAPAQPVRPAGQAVPGIPPAASPTVRRVAEDLGIDLSRVAGSERGGRITMADLRAYVQALQAGAGASAPPAAAPPKPAPEKIDFSKWGPVERKPASSLRQKIGQKMTESWTTVPHVTQFDEADITGIMALRKKHLAAYEKKGAKLTVTHFILKAVVDTLKKFPGFNASLDESSQEIVLKKYYHIGVAVDTEQGLIVPVLRDVDKKTLAELARELDALAEKTRQRKVSIDELKGGTFTISNLGSIGGQAFTPIINAPEVAILGVNRGILKPVVVNSKNGDAVEARLMMPLSLSYDHRVVDGADGARFMRALVEALQNFDEKDVTL